MHLLDTPALPPSLRGRSESALESALDRLADGPAGHSGGAGGATATGGLRHRPDARVASR